MSDCGSGGGDCGGDYGGGDSGGDYGGGDCGGDYGGGDSGGDYGGGDYGGGDSGGNTDNGSCGDNHSGEHSVGNAESGCCGDNHCGEHSGGNTESGACGDDCHGKDSGGNILGDEFFGDFLHQGPDVLFDDQNTYTYSRTYTSSRSPYYRSPRRTVVSDSSDCFCPNTCSAVCTMIAMSLIVGVFVVYVLLRR